MLFRVFNPSPELADVVKYYWYTSIMPDNYAKQQYATPLFEGIIFNLTKLKGFYQYEGKTTCVTNTAFIFGQGKSGQE